MPSAGIFYPSAQREMWRVSCCDMGLSQTMAHLFLHCQLALKAQLSNLIVLPAELGALLLIYSWRREKIGCEMRLCGCGVCLYSLKHGYGKVALSWNDKSKCFGVLQKRSQSFDSSGLITQNLKTIIFGT